MDYFELSWAVSSILIFVIITYLDYRLIKNFGKNEELTITKIYLNEKGPKAFKLFAAGIIIYGISMAVGALTISYSDYIYHYASKLGSGFMFLTWLYFMHTLSKISRIES